MRRLTSRKWIGFVILITGVLLGLYAVPKAIRSFFPPQTCPDQPAAVTSGDGHWIKGAPITTVRGETRVGTANGMIYFIGGLMEGWKASDLVDMYNPSSDSWTPRAASPGAVNHPGLATLNAKIYVSGGFNSPDFTFNLKTLWVYDPATDKWAALADMPEVRAAHVMVPINDKLYVVGGDGPADPTSVWMYDPATDKWDTSLAHMTSIRDHLAGAVADGKLYVMGGRREYKGKFSTTEVYDPVANTWATLADMPVPRSGLTADLLADGKIHVIGGEDIDLSCSYSEHDAYDPTTNTWTSETNLPVARHGMGTISIDNRWYVMAGATAGGSYTQRTFVPEVDIWVPNN
jgi:N-acetylneuraminic acid mutarotase